MSIFDIVVLLFLLGFVPLHVSYWSTRIPRESKRWQIQATFWRLTLTHRTKSRAVWQFEVPLLQRLSSAIWAAVIDLVQK